MFRSLERWFRRSRCRAMSSGRPATPAPARRAMEDRRFRNVSYGGLERRLIVAANDDVKSERVSVMHLSDRPRPFGFGDDHVDVILCVERFIRKIHLSY